MQNHRKTKNDEFLENRKKSFKATSKNPKKTVYLTHVVNPGCRFHILEPSPFGSASILRKDPNFPTDSLSTRHDTALPFKFLPPKKKLINKENIIFPNRFVSRIEKGQTLSLLPKIHASFEIRRWKTRGGCYFYDYLPGFLETSKRWFSPPMTLPTIQRPTIVSQTPKNQTTVVTS